MTTENPYDSFEADEVTRQEQQRNLVFPTLDAFVTQYLAPLLRDRDVTGVGAWCPNWWTHPEVIARFGAMWRAFEYLRHDTGLGLSHWWLHHLDPHMTVLLHPVTGPFRNCRSGHGDSPDLPVVPAPAELLDMPAFSAYAEDPFGPGSEGGRP
ncbi:DUF4913 domain-containing protein [Streptomyces sp. NBC_01618]|uniref:DUF4913 domain-containing protein n=1 Tax=Streptomyces sp. NBC_01618 TaxID=2975900 RepID=UPI00386D0685|nr:DUF4913 domain-containing protein [Streptomyces sp. NBC_01618]